ncbi:hypothetical protein LSAT2_003046 [Lamellibrachia satsuma]|nr:hypothetical protein LSAT2_003046 [Lamellibrachia satsuma]
MSSTSDSCRWSTRFAHRYLMFAVHNEEHTVFTEPNCHLLESRFASTMTNTVLFFTVLSLAIMTAHADHGNGDGDPSISRFKIRRATSYECGLVPATGPIVRCGDWCGCVCSGFNNYCNCQCTPNGCRCYSWNNYISSGCMAATRNHWCQTYGSGSTCQCYTNKHVHCKSP